LSQYEQFEFYQRVFNRFGFGQRISAMILSQIYPIENYLTEANKPHVIYRAGRVSGKSTKRHLSRRHFEKALGVAPTENSSGDYRSKALIGGSDLCRIALWQWIFCRLEIKRNRPASKIGQLLGILVDAEKASGKPVRLIRMRVAAKDDKMRDVLCTRLEET
jgi:hypothetical protein